MMRIVLDTNVLVSALISPGGLPEQLLQLWESDAFTIVTSEQQLNELERVLAYDKLQRFIRADSAARLLATLRGTAIVAIDLPQETASTDPADNVILATAASGKASHVVTGDKAHLLNLKQVGDIAIVTVKDAIALVLGQ